MAAGYGASNNGRYGYGAVPPEGITVTTSLSLGTTAHHVKIKAPPIPRQVVIIKNISNTLLILQALPTSRLGGLQVSQTQRISPRQKARIFLDDYDQAQLTELRKKHIITIDVI